jgi:predicted DNA-binding transcriptional regulator AlpA
MNNRRWFSAKETSEYFSIPQKSILRYAATGRFPRGSVIRIGKHVRFDIREIEEGFERARAKTSPMIDELSQGRRDPAMVEGGAGLSSGKQGHRE